MKKKCGIVAFVLLSLFSCEKEVSMDLPLIEETSVLFSIIQENKPIMVELSKTHSPFVDTKIPIDSACVILRNAVSSDTLRHLGNGQFESEFHALCNTRYEISAYVDGKLESHSFDSTPSAIHAEDVICLPFTDFIGANDDNEKYSGFSIVINDKPNESNFYEIKTDILFSNGETESRKCWCTDFIVEAEGINDFYPTTVLFSDKLIGQEQAVLTIFYQPPYYVDSNQLIDPDYRVIVHCRNVSENYYKYKKGLAAHLSGKEYDFWNSAGDPVPMYSNIEGGFGVFACYTETIDTISKTN